MWNKLKEKFWNRQFITFAVIGVINTVIALLINKVLIIAGVEAGIASIIADVLAFIPSYLMNMKFTSRALCLEELLCLSGQLCSRLDYLFSDC